MLETIASLCVVKSLQIRSVGFVGDAEKAKAKTGRSTTHVHRASRRLAARHNAEESRLLGKSRGHVMRTLRGAAGCSLDASLLSLGRQQQSSANCVLPRVHRTEAMDTVTCEELPMSASDDALFAEFADISDINDSPQKRQRCDKCS